MGDEVYAISQMIQYSWKLRQERAYNTFQEKHSFPQNSFSLQTTFPIRSAPLSICFSEISYLPLSLCFFWKMKKKMDHIIELLNSFFLFWLWCLNLFFLVDNTSIKWGQRYKEEQKLLCFYEGFETVECWNSWLKSKYSHSTHSHFRSIHCDNRGNSRGFYGNLKFHK